MPRSGFILSMIICLNIIQIVSYKDMVNKGVLFYIPEVYTKNDGEKKDVIESNNEQDTKNK